MRKMNFARLIMTVIIGVALALSVLTGCDPAPGGETVFYTVTFNSQGGSSVPAQRIESGKTASEPEDPAREGYTFGGWFEEGCDTAYDFTKAVTKDFTLSAKWTETSETVYLTVKFIVDGTEYKTERAENGKTVTEPSAPSKTGYTFAGWITAGGETYDFGKAVTSDVTLYAKWTKDPVSPGNPQTYTVRFTDAGAIYKTESVESGKTVSKPADPSKTGYTFAGWILSDGTAFDFTEAITADVTLYAKWTKNPTGGNEPETVYYTVTFNSNQGGEVFAQYVESGKKAAEPSEPERAGYLFGGWYKEASLTNLYDFDTAVTQDFTLHAKWIKDTVTAYTVSFNSNGGSKVLSQEVVTGGKAVIPAEPEKEDFVFAGWYLGENLYDFDTPVTSDITLTAKWIATADSAVCEVSFDTDGGSEVLSQEVEINGKAVRPEDPVKSGFSFAGWYIGETIYDFNTPVTADITLIAKWTEIAVTPPDDKSLSATIVFSDMAVGTYPEGTDFENGLITLKTGSWSVDENAGTITDAEGNSVSVTKRLKSVNIKSMEIDLSAYSGKVKLQFFVRTGNNSDLTRGVSLSSSDGTVIDSLTLTSSSMFTFEVTVDCGDIYTLTTLVNGVNFYGIVIVSVTPPPAESATLTVPEIPDDATVIDVGPSAEYKTIASALNYAQTLPASDIKVIRIAAGEYKEKLTISAPNVWFAGSSLSDGEKLSATKNNGVVIWYDDIAGKFSPASTSQSASVTVNATDFVAINITFKNYYNTHALYLDSLKISSSTQAVALAVNADRAGFYNCKITSYHDSLLANTGKQLYYNCWIEGRTDYIFGQNAIAYFENCDIWTIGAGATETNGGYVAAQKPSSSDYFYVFNNCRFDGDENVKDGSAALGRPWGAEMKMVVMNSYISDKFSTAAHTNGTTAGQRYCTMSGNEPNPANMLEYNNTGAGAVADSIANTCTYLTADEAGAYTLRNVLTLNGWNVTGDKQDLITFGTNGNYKDYKASGKLGGTATIADNGGDNSQVKEGYLTFEVTEGAVVTISSYSGHTNYTAAVNGGTPETVTGTVWKYVADGDGTIVITAVSSDNYFYSISILY